MKSRSHLGRSTLVTDMNRHALLRPAHSTGDGSKPHGDVAPRRVVRHWSHGTVRGVEVATH